MKNSTTQLVNNSSKILLLLKDCVASLSTKFIAVYNYPRALKKALYAATLIKTLQKNNVLLNYLNCHSQKHLSSILKCHGKQIIETLKQKSYQYQEITNITVSLTQLIEYLDNLDHNPLEDIGENAKLPPIINLVESFIQQCCKIIIMDNETYDQVSNLQAMNIVLSLDNLSLNQQNLLLEQLLIIKELWQIDHVGNNKREPVALLFHSNILALLKKDKVEDNKSALKKIIKFLIYDYNIFRELANAKLVNLYNRLKDLCEQSDLYHNILFKLHEESKFRLNYNKINDCGYELVKLFEIYNTILHQVENAEFAIVEKFLLKRNAFLHEILINITKHIDSIVMLSITEHLDLEYILYTVRKELTHNIQNGHTIALMISSVESKLSSNINSKVIKKYDTFDGFTKNALKNRYQLLFKNIISLLNMNKSYKEFIQHTIIYKISSDYKANINIDSSSTLRVIHKERKEIIKQLCEINFIELFSDKYLNKISSLNFKKYTRKEKIKSPLAYIKLIIQVLLNNFTVEQLQVLLQFISTDNLTTLHHLVKQEMVLQVKKRMTWKKIIYYIFTRRKNELIKLHNIKRNLNANSS